MAKAHTPHMLQQFNFMVEIKVTHESQTSQTAIPTVTDYRNPLMHPWRQIPGGIEPFA